MPTLCKAGEAIAKGDAVCVIGFDNNRPIVKRATFNNLKTSKTVLGVAEDVSAAGSVSVLVAGEVAKSDITSLGNGDSRIVVTNTDSQILNPNPNDPADLGIPEEQQCRLKRIDSPIPTPEGFVVGTCDENGNLIIQPRHSSYETGFSKVHNVRAYGAIPDWDQTNKTGTDNLAAFEKAIQAATNEYLNSSSRANRDVKTPVKIVAEGWFYLSNTLHIPRGIILEGIGNGYPEHSPGTMLVFDKDVTGIRIHSFYDQDIPAEWNPPKGVLGHLTQIRNLTVYCKQNRGQPPIKDGLAIPPNDFTGHGIHSNVVCTIRDVTVYNFAENGIFITAGGTPQDDPKYPGNAIGSHIVNTISAQNGAHGFHFLGVNTNASLTEMCLGASNWGNGFRDESVAGTTYVGCYGQANQGERGAYSKDNDPEGYSKDGRNHDFYVENNAANQSMFFGCYSEASVDHIYNPAGAIGGMLSQGTFAEGSNGFSLSSGGRVNMGPLITEYKHDPDGPRVEIGDYTGSKRALSFITKKSNADKDFLYFQYLATVRGEFHDWWEWQSSGPYRQVMRFPTVQSNARYPAPWMPNGLFIGWDTPLRDHIPGRQGLAYTIHMTAAPSPPPTQYDGTPQTYERGDIVWNSEPSPGGSIGQVCIKGGIIETINPPGFSTFGTVDSPSKSYTDNTPLTLADRYVTVTVTGKIITLPASPVDGQTHSIKCKVGVATTTINTSGGLTIDGQPTPITLNSGEYATFRFSDAENVKEWERR
jgi:hypothetical protein